MPRLETGRAAGAENITVEGLAYRYPGAEADALGVIDCRLAGGLMHVVLGRNGSGKSTLARCLNGLLLPREGKVVSCGLDTSEPANNVEVKKRIAMVFQDPDTQMVGATVEQEVAFGPENLGLDPEVIRRRVDEALDLAGIGHLGSRQPRRLSAGQKQLVAIAGALAMQPAFLISDESTAMLDRRARSRVLDLFDSLKARGMGIVHVTHFLDEAVRADQVLVLDAGRLVVEGAPGQVLSDPERTRALGLEPLPATLVARELASLGVAPPAGVTTMKELAAWLRA